MDELNHPDHNVAVTEKLQWELGLPLSCSLCGSVVRAHSVYWTGITGIERPICYACNYSAVFDSDPATRAAARGAHPILSRYA